MGLITENNAHYYSGQQSVVYSAAGDEIVAWTGNVSLVDTTSTTFKNYEVFINNVLKNEVSDYVLSNNVVTISASLSVGDIIIVQLSKEANLNFVLNVKNSLVVILNIWIKDIELNTI